MNEFADKYRDQLVAKELQKNIDDLITEREEASVIKASTQLVRKSSFSIFSYF